MTGIHRTRTIVLLLAISVFADPPALRQSITEAMANQAGVCVFIDCATGETARSDSAEAAARYTPCSTFKIWNTLTGLENKAVSSPDEVFYKWDGEKRFLDEWNRDQTLREAFRVSCVPAYQQLARTVGPERMKKWIDTIGYGDRNISSGIDIFWLPREGKKSIGISPEEQAVMLRRLVTGNLPFSKTATAILKDIMLVKKTGSGAFYGKTGSGSRINGDPKRSIGWFVGYVETRGKVYSFACLLKGENVSGKDARGVVEGILVRNEML